MTKMKCSQKVRILSVAVIMAATLFLCGSDRPVHMLVSIPPKISVSSFKGI